MSRRRRFKALEEPTKCKCQPGKDVSQHHAKPGKTAADHGDPFARKGGCIHSELQLTTAAAAKKIGVRRLRL